ncbi:hypothetical protein GGF32_004358 [Allomyces javanicus]|nr:hypothetical protein GGF32_004358 [Allomyces javanicus]
MRIPSSRGGSAVELIFDRDTASTVASTMQRSSILPAVTIESASTVSLTSPHAKTRSAAAVGPATSAREAAAHAHAHVHAHHGASVPIAGVPRTVRNSVASLPTTSVSNTNSLSDSSDSALCHPTAHSTKTLDSVGMASEYVTMPLAPRESTAPRSTPSMAQTTVDTPPRRFMASADGSLPTPRLRRASLSAPGPAGLTTTTTTTTTRPDSPTASPSTTKPRAMARRPGSGSPQGTMRTAPPNPHDEASSFPPPRLMPKSATVDQQHLSAAGLTVPMPAQLLLPGNVTSAIRHITIARSLARQRTMGRNGTMGSSASADLEAGRIAGVPDASSLLMPWAGESVSIDRPVSPTGEDSDDDDEEEDGGDGGAGGMHGMSKSAMSVPAANYLIVVPFTFAFCCDYGRDFIYSYFFFDCLCIARIAFNLVRPYIDQYGQLLFDPKSKRNHYFFHRSGWLDVVGAIPFDYIPVFIALADGSLDAMECRNPHFVYPDGHVGTGTHLGSEVQARFLYNPGDVPPLLFWFSVLRLLRLVGTTGTVRWALQANFPMVTSPISRLIKNLLLSVYLSHINTCGFWFMETRTNDRGRWITKNRLDLDDHGSLPVVWWRYLVTFFICQRALFFIHRHTVVPDEMLYQCMEALFAACLYGSILGNLSQIVRSFDTQATVDKAEKHRKIQRQFLAQYMINKHFPPILQRKVLQQEEFEWVHKRGVNTELLLGEALPKSLRLEVCVHLYYALICEVPLFRETDDMFKVALCERISLITAPKGFYACKAGDAGNEMYFIRRGGVDVLNKDETKVLTKLGVSAYFGEVALFQECRRTATVKTNTDTELCVLKKADFDDILSASPAMVAVFRKAVAEREERDAKRKEEEAAARPRYRVDRRINDAAQQHLARGDH